MPGGLSESELAEIASRVEEFRQNANSVANNAAMDFQLKNTCGSERAKYLFTRTCKLKATDEEQEEFFAHTRECESCQKAYVRTIWLATS